MLAERTYKQLKRMIFRGELKSGQRLVERKLSHRLGVSRVPLRESLLRLESEGLVSRVRRGPSRVMDFSKSDFAEMFSMRLLLEPFATRLAAAGDERSYIRKLKRICRSMTRAAKAKAWKELQQLDCEFHQIIVRAAGHKKLLQAYEKCHIQIIGVIGAISLEKEPPGQTALDHLPIVEALENHEAALAERLAYEHLASSVGLIKLSYGPELTPKHKLFFKPPLGDIPRRNGKG